MWQPSQEAGSSRASTPCTERNVGGWGFRARAPREAWQSTQMERSWQSPHRARGDRAGTAWAVNQSGLWLGGRSSSRTGWQVAHSEGALETPGTAFRWQPWQTARSGEGASSSSMGPPNLWHETQPRPSRLISAWCNSCS